MTAPKNGITADLARYLFNYDPDTGVLSWKNPRKKTLIGRPVGNKKGNNYMRVTVIVDRKLNYFVVHRIAWLVHYGRWPKDQLDHINGIRNDNRLCNLRECSQAENNANTRLYKNNKSGVKGVYWEPDRNSWAAYIRENKILRRIGRFETKEEAALARKQAFEDYYHEFCRYE